MLTVDYDTETDSWTVTNADVKLLDFDGVNQWQRYLLEEIFPRFGGKKVYVLVDLNGVEIGPRVAEEYGTFVRDFAKTYTHNVFRYGPPLGLTESVIKLQAVIQHFPANVYENRAAALRALEIVRAKDEACERTSQTKDTA